MIRSKGLKERPSFDMRQDAHDVFEKKKHKRKSFKHKKKEIRPIEEEVRVRRHSDPDTPSRKASFNLDSKENLPPPKPKKKNKKSGLETIDDHEQNEFADDLKMRLEEMVIDEEKEVSREEDDDVNQVMYELNVRASITEDLHIREAWGTITPRRMSRENRLSFDQEIPEWAQHTSVVDEADGDGSGWMSLVIHDGVEEHAIEFEQHQGESDPEFFQRKADDSYEYTLHDVIDEIREKESKTHIHLPESIRRLLIEANMGWTESQFTLGYCYDTGSGGVEANTEDAIEWYTEAANSGHITAQNNLGVLLATGHRGRVKKNFGEAFYWYKKAAESGHPNAEFHVGLCYLKGDGVQRKDEDDAFCWFKKAAKQGHMLGETNVGAMYMSGQGTDQNFKKAMKWSKKAALQGSAIAAHNLAVMYKHGYGARVSEDKSRNYLEDAMTGVNRGAIPKKLSEETLRAGNTLMNM